MKSILYILLTLSFSCIHAQDLIVITNGDEILSKVIEVTKTEVKYKKISNIEGPTYTLNKSEIVFVKYENGEKDIFKKEINSKDNNTTQTGQLRISGRKYYLDNKKISKKEFKSLLETNDLAYSYWKSSRGLYVVALITVIPGGASLGWYMGANGSEVLESDKSFLIMGIGFTATSLITALFSDINKNKSVKIYNDSRHLSCDLKLSQNGIGLVINL